VTSQPPPHRGPNFDIYLPGDQIEPPTDPPPPVPWAPPVPVSAPPAPRELRTITALLLINLALSIVLTIVTLAMRDRLVNYQLDHRHITDPAQRAILRDGYVAGIVSRVVGNIVASVVYAFLVRGLFRGRRWAYRRVLYLGVLGTVGLVLLQTSPYPTWMRVEQLAQAFVLLSLVYFVSRPPVREYFAEHLPGRAVRRFRG
jgi:hypothetical protein